LRRREALAVLGGAAVSWAALPAKLPALDEAGFQKLLASQKGKVVLFDFWATWCEPCRAEMPALVKMMAQLAPKGLAVITVSADEPEDNALAVEFLRKAGYDGPAYLKVAKSDDAFINFIDPKWSGALPAKFLYDRAGKKVKSFIGETEKSVLEAEIKKLL
jgi:thiol-disulfide isomerase/thioredoxin